MFRFHVIALPHTQTHKRHNACAYTMKVFNFCKMMRDRGHTVFHYGAEGSNPPCSEHIDIITTQEQRLLFGAHDFKKQFYNIVWDTRKPYWQLCNARAVVEILRRKKRKDFVCIIGGTCQKPITDALPRDVMSVEYGIGYRGVYSSYRVFESYAHMQMIWGSEKADRDGSFYDVVIPNYYDPAEFPYHARKENYYLYLGRLIRRKGLEIAVQATKQIGARLKIAGQGVVRHEPGKITTADGVYEGKHIEYVGYADVKRRAQLLGRARGVFVPTVYVEPFGGVNVEAQLCGTPVITTDWGAFPETVEHGKTGYRCRTLEQFVWAAKNVHQLDTRYIHDRAVRLYSLERVAGMYEEYFAMLYDLWDAGWGCMKRLAGRTGLEWLNPA
jgi:glycosyltransferase involved in cell wall biosynthesis